MQESEADMTPDQAFANVMFGARPSVAQQDPIPFQVGVAFRVWEICNGIRQPVPSEVSGNHQALDPQEQSILKIALRTIGDYISGESGGSTCAADTPRTDNSALVLLLTPAHRATIIPDRGERVRTSQTQPFTSGAPWTQPTTPVGPFAPGDTTFTGENDNA